MDSLVQLAGLSCLHGSIIATSTVLQIMEAFKTLHPWVCSMLNKGLVVSMVIRISKNQLLESLQEVYFNQEHWKQ